uniref:Uncharacterized protein n=1 Tax=Ascaris lumbricoides TaxID=6252 RepID=A0A0M3HVX7_ASCLU
MAPAQFSQLEAWHGGCQQNNKRSNARLILRTVRLDYSVLSGGIVVRTTSHTFYGNFFVRTFDLLVMDYVSPNSAIASQHSTEEGRLSDSREDIIQMLDVAFKAFNLAVAQQACPSSFLSPNAPARLLP